MKAAFFLVKGLMRPVTILISLFVLASSILLAAEPALPAVPAVLEPLKAKINKGWGQQKVVTLRLRADQAITDEQWKAIETLGAKGIGIGGKAVDDEVIARIAKMDLESLSLDGAEGMSDACFKSIATMKSLRVVSVGHIMKKEFTGTGLALLKDLPALERLGFGGTGAGDPAMEAVGELTQLKEFQTWHSHAKDPRNLYLLKLTSLKALELGNGMPTYDGKPRQLSLTDETMDTIVQLKNLERLFFTDARLSLPALEKLKALPNLKSLDLMQVDIPPEDIDKLRAELPNVKIQRRPPLTEAEHKRLDQFLKVP